MLRFILRKAMNKRYLTLSLLLGNLLLVAIAASSPMYTVAALQRMLTGDLGRYVTEKGQSPTVVQVFASSASEDNPVFEQEQDLLADGVDVLRLRVYGTVLRVFYLRNGGGGNGDPLFPGKGA